MNYEIRLLEYGIFVPDDTNLSKTFDFQSPKEYFYDVHSAISLARPTDKIPLERGMAFGIKFIVESEVEISITLHIKILHPELENPDNNFIFSETSQFKTLPADMVHTELYILDYKWEMMPGFWTFQVEHNSVILLAKEFELYVAETIPDEEEEVFFYDM